jgi:type I restriction enzyme S subunit
MNKLKLKQTEIGEIPEDWDVSILADHINIIGGGTPKTDINEYWNGDIPWISVVDFVGSRKYIYDTEKHITKKGLENSSTKLLHKGQLIISARGTVGELGQVMRDMAFNQSCYGIDGDEYLDNNYLYYLLKKKIKEFKQKGHGAVFTTITKETFNQILIPLLKIAEQKAIAKILSDLDSKIELLQQQNKTLESISKTFFKQWFVDFEFPNEEGKPYKSSGGEMIESELGEIPKGWEIEILRNLINKNKKPIKNYEDWKDKDLIDLSNMPQFSMSIINFDKGEKFKSNIFELDEGDILFGSIRPYFGKYGFSPINGVVTGTIFSFKPINNEQYSFVLNTICRKEFVDYTVMLSKGTKMPIIGWNDFVNFKFAISSDTFLIAHFNNLVYPTILKMKTNIQEIIALQKTRDSLLPMLMSGKIRAPIEVQNG